MFGGGLNVASLGNAPGVTSHEFVVHIFGHDFGLWGTVGYFLNSKVYDVGIFTLFLFQLVFMDNNSDYTNWSYGRKMEIQGFRYLRFLYFHVCLSTFWHWVWGGGWLSQLGAMYHLGHGHVDFAGSSVVHELWCSRIGRAYVIGAVSGNMAKMAQLNYTRA